MPVSGTAILDLLNGKTKDIDILILESTYNTTAEQNANGIIMH